MMMHHKATNVAAAKRKQHHRTILLEVSAFPSLARAQNTPIYTKKLDLQGHVSSQRLC